VRTTAAKGNPFAKAGTRPPGGAGQATTPKVKTPGGATTRELGQPLVPGTTLTQMELPDFAPEAPEDKGPLITKFRVFAALTYGTCIAVVIVAFKIVVAAGAIHFNE